jgi:hypothetical protein
MADNAFLGLIVCSLKEQMSVKQRKRSVVIELVKLSVGRICVSLFIGWVGWSVFE